MRRFMLLLGIGLVTGGVASAQQMPGQHVGKPLVAPVGTQLPQAGTPIPKVGMPPSGFGGQTSANPYAPQKSPVDPKLVAAPFPTGMPGTAPKSFWDNLYDRWLGVFGLNTPAQVQRNWTPGLGRRNKERKDATWVRD